MSEILHVEKIVKDLLHDHFIRYSEARTFRGMSVVPLIQGEPVDGDPAYAVFDDALTAGIVAVEEVGAGTVPQLRVRNMGERPVLIMDGEHLVGAKQNRILNTTILVAAKTVLDIPVSCVEAGRWAEGPRLVGLADAALFPQARGAKTAAVTRSLRSSGSYLSDQNEIWHHVAARLHEVGVSSPTFAMADIATYRGSDLEEHVRAFPWLEGQVGVVCGIAGQPACVDLFDHPRTLQKLYPRLIRSYALDALGIESGEALSADTARQFVERAQEAVSTIHPAVGMGEEVRLTGAGVVGSALVVDERAIHLALFRGDGTEQRSGGSFSPPSRRWHRISTGRRPKV
jgi:hypothetical protein